MTTESPQPETDEGKAPKELREHAKRLEAENKAFKDTLLNQAFRIAGMPDFDKGLGKTMRDGYDGEADSEEILAYARENFDWAPPENTTPASQTTEVAAAISASQERIGAAQSQATGQIEGDLNDRIARAESAGNWTEAIQLKLEKLKGLSSG